MDADRYDPQQVEPKWAAAWEEMTLARIRGPSRTAAQVSSQDVSTASSFTVPDT